MLVLDGEPVELDAHLARLEAGLETLYPDHLAPDLREEIATCTNGVELGSVRVTIAPVGATQLDARVALRRTSGGFMPLSGRKSPVGEVALNSLNVAAGLGAHKWADRSLLDEAQSGLPADSLPLIVDKDGAVLEASRASVFAVRDGALFTPPLDGRILPGITRMRVLELAGEVGIHAHEAELSRADLLAADEAFLTGSVRGIERAESLDGAPLQGGAEIIDRLATELWQAWTGAKAAI
jgi:para-aminobenzoate synthetase/4-amino-4-deoxychorismate lyase